MTGPVTSGPASRTTQAGITASLPGTQQIPKAIIVFVATIALNLLERA